MRLLAVKYPVELLLALLVAAITRVARIRTANSFRGYLVLYVFAGDILIVLLVTRISRHVSTAQGW